MEQKLMPEDKLLIRTLDGSGAIVELLRGGDGKTLMLRTQCADRPKREKQYSAGKSTAALDAYKKCVQMMFDYAKTF